MIVGGENRISGSQVSRNGGDRKQEAERTKIKAEGL